MAHNTAALVARFKASGMKQTKFCRQNRISVSGLQYQLSKARKRRSSIIEATADSSQGRFIPLRMVEAEAKQATVLLLRGNVGCKEIAELFREISC
jgi:hypothetical protein